MTASATTREVLRGTMALAEARGATFLILVPQFNGEDALERNLRRRILDDAEVTPGLRAIRQREADIGLDRWPRVCMRRDIPAA